MARQKPPGPGVTLVCLLVLAALTPCSQAEVLPSGLKIEKLIDWPTELTSVRQSPRGDLWLLERAGTVRVLRAGVERASLTLQVSTTCGEGLLDVAFAEDFSRSRLALVSYVEPAGGLRVNQLIDRGNGLSLGGSILVVEGAASGCRPGGALIPAGDGTIWIGVGDLEDPAASQDPAVTRGKLLRLTFNGSIPPDNPDPLSPLFARGFRDPAAGTLFPIDDAPGSQLYLLDRGEDVAVNDEINRVAADGNHGWAVVVGPSGGAFDDPIEDHLPSVGARRVTTISDDRLGPGRTGLIYSATATDELRQLPLDGDGAITGSGDRGFFDPTGDRDGTPDSGCPLGNAGVTTGRDGRLYTVNRGANPGLWRIWNDRPGPREVSPPGSPFPLTLGKLGDGIRIAWERLGTLDTGRPVRNGGQRAETYQIWEGSLPIDSSYDHHPLVATDGVPDGPVRLTTFVDGSPGDRYYLVTAQGDNLEGSAGDASTGTPRQAEPTDYCEALGVGNQRGQCIDEFRHPLSGEPIKLIDYNPLSPTYMQALSIRDFRGEVVHLDIAAFDCFWCQLQAPTFPPVDVAFGDRDFTLVTVLNASEFFPRPYADPTACMEGIAAWVALYGERTPVLCDVDLDGNGDGDITQQFWHAQFDPEPCGGFSQNFFIDQGGAIFDFVCSFVGGETVGTIIAPEINAESCE